jgi:hypothetical protein
VWSLIGCRRSTFSGVFRRGRGINWTSGTSRPPEHGVRAALTPSSESGWKNEMTPTWSRMFSRDGSRLGPVETMAQLWGDGNCRAGGFRRLELDLARRRTEFESGSGSRRSLFIY